MSEESTNRIGFRHVFGVIVPDFNSVVEPELASLRPAGVSNQTTRFAFEGDIIEQIATVAERLLAAGVRSWIVGLSTESFPGGLDLLQQGVDEIGRRTGLPVHTPAHATRAALDFMGARRLGVVTPFDDASNAHVRDVYEGWGYEVVAVAGLDRPGFDQIASTPDGDVETAFAAVAKDDVDTLVQVGTGLPTLHQIGALEHRFDRPLVAANLAAYWHALRAAGIDDEITGAGRLLSAGG